MTTSSYLKRPLRKYEEALSDVEKFRETERLAAARDRQKKARLAARQRPAA